jgi:pyruvate/2-oxoglutarate dehydrogenase complex dihydrolipoamide dehydrogenase (E3) component
MKILVGHKVTGGKNNGTSVDIDVVPVKGGGSKTFTADHVLVATGRKPYNEGV